MDKRQRLINMINASREKNDNWFQSIDPNYCEYINLRHRLGLVPENLYPLNDVAYGTHIEDVGELADQNRAMWRKWIEEHKDDVFLNDGD